MIYFTSDTHYCHSNIIKMCSRPYENIEQMHKALIANWNAYVSNHDEVYILGDFAFRVGDINEVNDILRKLKGKKYLVKGNHEKYLSHGGFDASAFEWVKDYHVMNYKDARFILFHYPILEWQHYHRKSAHLYGHVHHNISHIKERTSRLSVLGKRAVNVGVDCNDYFPVSAEDVYNRAFGDNTSDEPEWSINEEDDEETGCR